MTEFLDGARFVSLVAETFARMHHHIDAGAAIGMFAPLTLTRTFPSVARPSGAGELRGPSSYRSFLGSLRAEVPASRRGLFEERR